MFRRSNRKGRLAEIKKQLNEGKDITPSLRKPSKSVLGISPSPKMDHLRVNYIGLSDKSSE